MYIKINGKSHNVRVCSSFKDKLLGFMFKKEIDEIICLKNTSSIHTFFMRQNIDIIFFKNKKIINICYNVKPWRIIINKGNSVIELPENTIKQGDKIELFN